MIFYQRADYFLDKGQYIALEVKLYFICTSQSLSDIIEQEYKDPLYPDGIT